MKNLLLSLLLLLPLSTFAGGGHYTPLPPPVNVNNGDGHNHGKAIFGVVLGTLIGCGIYAVGWNKVCFTGEPIDLGKSTGASVPENPQNEYTGNGLKIRVRQK